MRSQFPSGKLSRRRSELGLAASSQRVHKVYKRRRCCTKIPVLWSWSPRSAASARHSPPSPAAAPRRLANISTLHPLSRPAGPPPAQRANRACTPHTPPNPALFRPRIRPPTLQRLTVDHSSRRALLPPLPCPCPLSSSLLPSVLLLVPPPAPKKEHVPPRGEVETAPGPPCRRRHAVPVSVAGLIGVARHGCRDPAATITSPPLPSSPSHRDPCNEQIQGLPCALRPSASDRLGCGSCGVGRRRRTISLPPRQAARDNAPAAECLLVVSVRMYVTCSYMVVVIATPFQRSTIRPSSDGLSCAERDITEQQWSCE